MSIRHGELDSFSAMRNAACEDYQSAFIEEPVVLSECILDALESPVPQFLESVLELNGLRTVPLTLDNILLCASGKTWRQDHRPGTRQLYFTERPVLFEDRIVQQGLHNLVLSEFERYRKRGQSQEYCYGEVLVAPDADGWSLLHRLCGGSPGYTVSGAVKFLLTELKPEDVKRHDSKGNPPLFTALQRTFHWEGAALDDQARVVQSFFEFDPDGSKRTRNAAGHGPLGFAFTHATFQILPLIFELCGANYSVVQFEDSPELQTHSEFERRSPVFRLDCKGERLQVAVKDGFLEIDRFIRWLTDLDSEPEVLNMLQSLILDRPQEGTRGDFVNGVTKSSDTLQTDHRKAAKVLLTLRGAEKLPKNCRPKLEDLGKTQLRKLLLGLLRASINRFDIGNFLPTQHQSDLKSTDPEENCRDVHEQAARHNMGPQIISLMRLHGGHTDFSSRETQEELLKMVRDNIFTSKEAGIDYPEDLKKYVEVLIQYADAAGDCHFAASLEYVRQCF